MFYSNFHPIRKSLISNGARKTIALILGVLAMAFLIGYFVFAWEEPSQTPPGGNVPAPINVGGNSQYKSGALGVGGLFRGYSNAIFDGKVGIGTTTFDPYTSGLQIKPSARQRFGVLVTDTDGSQAVGLVLGSQGEGQISVHDSNGAPRGYLTVNSSNSGTLQLLSGDWIETRISSNGNSYFMGGKVGIGTTNPTSKLHVKSDDVYEVTIENSTSNKLAALRFTESSGASSAREDIRFTDNDGNTVVYLTTYPNVSPAPFYITSDGVIMLSTGGSERIKISENGNVGIGTTTPEYKLDVNGDVRIGGALKVKDNSGNFDSLLSNGIIKEKFLPYCKEEITSDVYSNGQDQTTGCNFGGYSGYYDISNLTPENVKEGVTFGRGQTGTLETGFRYVTALCPGDPNDPVGWCKIGEECFHYGYCKDTSYYCGKNYARVECHQGDGCECTRCQWYSYGGPGTCDEYKCDAAVCRFKYTLEE